MVGDSDPGQGRATPLSAREAELPLQLLPGEDALRNRRSKVAGLQPVQAGADLAVPGQIEGPALAAEGEVLGASAAVR